MAATAQDLARYQARHWAARPLPEPPRNKRVSASSRVPLEKIGVRGADENLEGMFSGQAIWPADRQPISPKDLARYLRWLEWSRADLLALVKGIGDKRLRSKPASGRSLREILLHVLDADKAYVYRLVGVFKPMGEPANAALKGDLDLRVALAESRSVAIVRLAKLTPLDRS